ncbi:SWIM zinc finger family protein [Actinophytocola gossypii]|uniref:SWIM-type domain-containing protein n=1 Tax=Actinophytocola gossypii TaxID=2812003 RepID=A0ABT2JG40_9PSEU|nr:hypothetical protein [Actinophytocola gossypii]MCT2586405.1 hypothetical protein [Actinophytocola gossypii]
MTEALGFPAFPPSKRRPGRFARTWWGQAWLQAMEDTSLENEPLKQGRRLAYAGRVGPVTVSPGRISAQVTDPDGVYHTVVFVDRLDDGEWRRFLDEVAAKAGHIAALLDRDMPQELVEAAAQADVRLLPGIGDLRAECDCQDWELCRHAAALCFQAAWLLDTDPFLLLLLRGRARRDLTDELRERAERNSARSASENAQRVFPLAVPPAPGVDREAVAGAAALAVERARTLLEDRHRS